MRAVIMMFDSLNRHMLEPYGGTAYTPNFARLAEHSAQFDTSYVMWHAFCYDTIALQRPRIEK